MPAYNEVNGIPVHASEYLLREILRKEYGFKGYVFADYGRKHVTEYSQNNFR